MAGIAAELGEASTSTVPSPENQIDCKPVIVRVKRKACQEKLDAFWLEINERPHKRPILDLADLSISDSGTRKALQDIGNKKLLVQHLETVRHSEATKDVLHSFLQQNSKNAKELKKHEERRSFLKLDKKHDQLRSVARKRHEEFGRNARFEQIWKSRRTIIDAEEDSLREMCQLYDVVRVDPDDETPARVQKLEFNSDDDNELLCNYLPLIREFLPQAAAQIQSDLETREDKYVYDLYTVGDGLDTNMKDAEEYPLVQVNDDNDYYDGSMQSEYDSDDSNAEDNPRNDYPDEESSGEDGNEDPFGDLEYSNSDYEHEDDIGDDDDNWRWGYR